MNTKVGKNEITMYLDFQFMRRFVVAGWVVAFAALRAMAADGDLKWAFSTLSTATPGAIVSSPAIGPDGTVYFGVQVGMTSADAGGRVVAVSPNGALQWAVTLPDWVDSSPAVAADGTVYVGCWDGKLYALAGADGAKKWEYRTGGYIASSPAVSGDGTIYVGAGDLNLHAVNPDGTVRWLYPTADWVDGTPAVGVDGTVYVAAGRVLYAVRSDGVGLWQATLLAGMVGAPALASDGTVYAAARDKRVYAFGADGVLQWFFEAGEGFDASPVLGVDGTIYVGALDGRFYAVGRDGVEKWRFPRAGERGLEPIYSTAAVRADGSVVFGSGNNAVYALNADGTLRWKSAIGDWADSSPAIAADGTIYLGSYDKKLYALHGSVGPAESDWPMFKRSAARAAWQSRGLVVSGDGRLANTSVRAVVADAAEEALVVGFSVEGEGTRALLVRGVGPALAQFGLSDAVMEPELKVLARESARVLLENRGWDRGPNALELARRAAAAGAFPLREASGDAAALAEFARGGYAVQVASATARRGVVLAEIYDTGGAEARLINVSARARGGAGSDVLTAGFTVEGGARTLLIRGVGPGLTRLGMTGTLADPRLRLFAGSEPEAVAANDDWREAPNATTAAAAMLAVGAFALDPQSRDAAMLVLVEPGSYTVQVSGVGGATGVALIEVYEVR